jgi:hypothetical protein
MEPWGTLAASFLQSVCRFFLCQSQSHIATGGQSVSKSWCRAPADIYYCLTGRVLFLWGALSDERTGLSFVYAADPCQRSLPRVRVPWDSRPYFTVSDLRLPFSPPPTIRRVTVEVFDPTSTRVRYFFFFLPRCSPSYEFEADRIKNTISLLLRACPFRGNLIIASLPSAGLRIRLPRNDRVLWLTLASLSGDLPASQCVCVSVTKSFNRTQITNQTQRSSRSNIVSVCYLWTQES